MQTLDLGLQLAPQFVEETPTSPWSFFIDRKIDAFLASTPLPQELRARGIGHSHVNSSTDRPRAQYFCCMLTGRTEFVRRYPVATKRVLRAILKAAELCATERERAAQLLVDRVLSGLAPKIVGVGNMLTNAAIFRS